MIPHRTECLCLECANAKTTLYRVYARFRGGEHEMVTQSWWRHLAEQYADRLVESYEGRPPVFGDPIIVVVPVI